MAQTSSILSDVFEIPVTVTVQYDYMKETYEGIVSLGMSQDEEGLMYLFTEKQETPAYMINMTFVRYVKIDEG